MPVRAELTQETWWFLYVHHGEVGKYVEVKRTGYLVSAYFIQSEGFSIDQTVDDVLFGYSSGLQLVRVFHLTFRERLYIRKGAIYFFLIKKTRKTLFNFPK